MILAPRLDEIAIHDFGKEGDRRGEMKKAIALCGLGRQGDRPMFGLQVLEGCAFSVPALLALCFAVAT